MDQRSPDTRPLGVQTAAVHAGDPPNSARVPRRPTW